MLYSSSSRVGVVLLVVLWKGTNVLVYIPHSGLDSVHEISPVKFPDLHSQSMFQETGILEQIAIES